MAGITDSRLNLKLNWCNFAFVESCFCLLEEGRVCDFLVTSGDEWYLASSFLGWGRAEQAKPPINTLDCGHFIDTRFTGPWRVPFFFFFLVHSWMFIFFQTITLFYPYEGAEACLCCQWLHICMARSSPFLIEGRNVPLSTDCQHAINAELLIIIPAHNQAHVTQMGTPTYSINHRRPSLSYFLHPGQQNTLHVVLKLSSDH